MTSLSSQIFDPAGLSLVVIVPENGARKVLLARVIDLETWK